MDDNFIIGYGSWAAVSTPRRKAYHDASSIAADSAPPAILTQFIISQVTSASITRTLQIPTQNSYYLPFSSEKSSSSPALSPIRLGYGVYSYSGEISFEFTEGMLRFLSDSNADGSPGETFARDAIFDVQFFDGRRTCTIYNCVWSALSIQAQPNSLVTGSISFQTNNGYNSDLLIYNGNVLPNYRFDDADLNIPYWQTGASEFESFSISFERSVQPVYLNNDLKCPSYLRPGMVSSSMSVTTIDHHSSWSKGHVDPAPGQSGIGDISVKLGSKTIVLKAAAMTSHQIGLPSMNDAAQKQYSWSSQPLRPNDPQFVISSPKPTKPRP